MAASLSLCGAVLVGGASRRFGSDKSLADVDGVPLGRRVADCARAAGVDPVVAVGGTSGARLGLVTIADEWPGAGPLAGVATVLRWAPTTHVLVMACDLVGLRSEAVAALVDQWRHDNDPDAGVVASIDGRPELTLGIWPVTWRRSSAQLVAAGERRWSALATLGPTVPVEIDGGWLRDADTPDQLDAASADLNTTGRGPKNTECGG